MEKELMDLRHLLHRRPELSGEEEETAEILSARLMECHPDELVTGLGGNGILAVFNGRETGMDVLLRCDMDAVPVQESTGLPFASETPETSHACGHDGHMAIMTGVAGRLAETAASKGRVLLLFQPREENGSGALRVLDDPRFSRFEPDLVFALHNLPGFPRGSIVTSEGPFAGASRGLIIEFRGKSSHAGEPLLGISPAPALASLIDGMDRLCQHDRGVLVTLIHAEIGEVAFGTSPEKAVVMATLRAPTEELMDELSEAVLDLVRSTADRDGLRLTIQWTEEFPATVNSRTGSELVCEAAEKLGLEIVRLSKPFPWSEDFGHFTSRFKGALFGLGAGTGVPPLHSPYYDFPDALIPVGIAVLMKLIEGVLKVE